jgi:hypothetical protein
MTVAAREDPARSLLFLLCTGHQCCDAADVALAVAGKRD